MAALGEASAQNVHGNQLQRRLGRLYQVLDAQRVWQRRTRAAGDVNSLRDTCRQAAAGRPPSTRWDVTVTEDQLDIGDLLGSDTEPAGWADANEPDDDSLHLDLEDAEGRVDERWIGDQLVLSWRRRRDRDTVEMLRYDPGAKLLRIFPKVRRGAGYDNPFSQIEELQIQGLAWDPQAHSAEGDRDGLLRVVGLPRGFDDIYAAGLGVTRRYRGLLNEIEERTRCTTVRFTTSGAESEDGEIFAVALERFERYRAGVDTSRRRADTAYRSVVAADRHNAVADLFGLGRVAPKYGRHPVIQALTEEIETGHVLSTEDRDALVEQVSARAPTVARESAERFGRLRQDIELVSLEVLIDQFDRALAQRTSESTWQRFFTDNPFALQQLFSAPLLLLDGQVHVRGTDGKGRGSRITDFLCVNAVTRSAVTVEIKKPSTPLMEEKSYRGSATAEVFPPHRELSRAVSQVHAQMESVPRDMRPTPAFGDIDQWHVRGAVIIGRVAELGDEQRASFLRYREGLVGVTVLGYDEVGERLKSLRDMLADPTAPPRPEESTTPPA